jgi:4-amino-4-deoxy-L-arabinose transferase-like glycosyltransferase
MTIAAEPSSTRSRERSAVFRGRPKWVPVVLGGILVAAALLYTWNIGYSGLSTYYAAAAKSMSESWHALAFGALDPAATTTLDKLSGFLVPQALAVNLFGFHAWALSLPQAIEGVVTVYASYVVGTRWRGHLFGLATAGLMAFTPMLAAMFGKPMEDGLLTMAMVLAFVAWQRAVLSEHPGWLILAAAWVAVGFQAKMLQSWLILPALAIGYFVAVGGSVRTRLIRIAAAGLVTLVLSLSWITIIQLVPAGDRPYIDGTTNNNAYSMVFGYNGVDRIVPGVVPGAVPQLDSSPGSGQTPTNGTATEGAGHSIAKLVLPQFTTQIGWLYPAALAGSILGLLTLFRRRLSPDDETDRMDVATTAALVLWAGLTAVILSLAFVPHATYFAVIALPLSMLAVLGATESIQLYRRGSGRSWIPIVVLIVVQCVWSAVVVLTGPPLLGWVAIPVLLLGMIATVALVLLRAQRSGSRRLRLTVVTAVASAMVGPVIWSLCVLGPGGSGSASDAFAGPRPVPIIHPASTRPRSTALRRPFTAPSVPGLDTAQKRLLSSIGDRNQGRSWLFATDTMAIAVSFTLYSGHEVVPMGGFSRQAPNPRLGQLRSELAHGKVRFVLLSAPTTPRPSNPVIDADRNWVTTHCVATISGAYRQKSRIRQTLYDCAAHR